MTVLKFPTQHDINKYYGTCRLKQTNDRILVLLNKNTSTRLFDFAHFKKVIDFKEFLWQLHSRLMDTAKSYSLLSYFFKKGIPDEEWHVSPGNSGASIEYFPHFQPIHYAIKDWFDYYSDVFYYKFFSALDMVGHILNVRYELGIKQSKVSFQSVVVDLRDKDHTLHTMLEEIINSTVYREGRRFRNNITHNYLPSSTGMSVNMSEQGGSIGMREYTPSAVIMGNIEEILALLDRVIAVTIA